MTGRTTVAQICRQANISQRMFYMAQEVHRAGVPEVRDWIMRGDLSMNLALQICRFTHDEQREILAEFQTLTPRQRTHMLRLMLKPAIA